MKYRTAFITGASSGIGRGLAILMAQEGVEVALAARRVDALEEVAEHIRSHGGTARVYPLDVTNAAATQEVVRNADDDMSGIDIVVANAGLARPRWSGKLEWEHCEQTIMVNVAGTVATITAVVPRMVDRKRGHVVAISSLASFCGLPKFATYSASKAFIRTFLESLRVDLRAVGIKVTDVRPGFVKTPLNEGADDTLPFLVELDDATRIIWRGIQRGKPVVQFPWQLVALLQSAGSLPPLGYDIAAKFLKF